MMKTKLYRLLVSRNSAIFTEYQKHQSTRRADSRPFGAFSSLCYAAWLNVRWHLLRDRSIGRPDPPKPYPGVSESRAAKRESPAELAKQLMEYDAVSFDIFDTLVFRPFSTPKELFAGVGEQLHIPDFVRIRTESEHTARLRNKKAAGHFEVTLAEIYDVIAEQVQFDKEAAAALEFAEECALCTANPYMQQVFTRLREAGVPIYLVSDMYLASAAMETLLRGCGYNGWEQLLVSVDYNASKFDGGLYDVLRAKLPEGARVVHVGDHPRSDVEMAQEAGLDAVLYENVNTAGNPYRALRGCYGGMVNAYLHCGLADCSGAFEFGYVYAGPLLAGWCAFLHETSVTRGLLPAIPAACELACRVYKQLYPDDELHIYAGEAPETAPMDGYFAALPDTSPLYHALRDGERLFESGATLYGGCGFAVRDVLELCETVTGLVLRGSQVAEGEISGGAGTFAEHWLTLREKRPSLCRLTAVEAAAPLKLALEDAAWPEHLRALLSI